MAFYRIDLAEGLGAGQEVNVDVETVFAHVLQPYPHSITQAEKQYVKFSGNRLFYSPYKTKSLTTEVQCSSSTIESYTKTKAAVSEHVITYGSFEDVQKFSEVSHLKTISSTKLSDKYPDPTPEVYPLFWQVGWVCPSLCIHGLALTSSPKSLANPNTFLAQL